MSIRISELSNVRYMSDHVSLAIESYCYVAEDFKYVFYQYLSILEASNELVKEAYSKYDTSASTSSHGNSGNKSGNGSSYGSNSSSTTTTGNRKGNTVYVNAPILETTYHKWWCTSIDLNAYNTVVHKIVVPKTSSSRVQSTKDEYIEDCDTGKRYYIQSSSIGFGSSENELVFKRIKAIYRYFSRPPSLC